MRSGFNINQFELSPESQNEKIWWLELQVCATNRV